jgi:hypothetical protein
MTKLYQKNGTKNTKPDLTPHLTTFAFFLHNHLLLVIPESFTVFGVSDGSHVGGHGFFEITG